MHEKKTKVGIISMQRVCNYGSFLQAYGLKKIIESKGNDVIFVDYRRGKPVTAQSNKLGYYKSILREKIINILSRLNKVLFLLSDEIKNEVKHKYRYENEFLPILGISKKRNYGEKVDTLVIGSDEVFNCLQANPTVGFSPELFGANRNANKLLSYAASFGNTTIDGIASFNKTEELTKYFSEFDAISVRDKNSVETIKTLLNKTPEYHIDPVLAYDFSKEDIPQANEENYIIVYAYRKRITPEEALAIKAFAKEKNKKIISIGGFQDFSDKHVYGTPFEILGYFKKADYVITDTFHGTIFSIINQRKFVTFIRKGHGATYGNYEKLMDLLTRFNLENRACFDISKIKDIADSDIDYNVVNEKIQIEREKTSLYLDENLNK